MWLSLSRAESDVLDSIKLRPCGMAVVKQPGQAWWAHGPSLVGVLTLGAPVTLLTEGLSSRVPSITID